MKKNNMFLALLFVILFSVVLSSSAFAVPLKFNNVNPHRLVSTNVFSSQVYAGIYNIEVGGAAYDAFCLDLLIGVPYSAVDYTRTDLKNASDAFFSPAGMGEQRANDIAELWYDNYSPTMSADNAAGLQIAIWEVTSNDGAYDVWDAGSTFYLTSGSDYGADAMLSALDGNNFASLQGFANGNYQDYVTANPVPEPSSMLLMGFGLLGLVVYTRKMHFKA